MTDELRKALRDFLKEQGISQTELAELVGTDRHTISRALSSNGKVPAIWAQMLDSLGLELVLRPKQVA